MPQEDQEFRLEDAVSDVEKSYENHPGFRHAFWEWMARGEFDEKFLQQFALHYYEHVAMFRQYIARALAGLPAKRSEEIQVALSAILSDEYGLDGSPSHPELFRGFMHSLGLSKEDWHRDCMISGISQFRERHFELFDRGDAAETMGAVIFGFERTTPYRHGRVITGIKAFNARTGNTVDDRFFTGHVEIDPHHSQSLIEPSRELFRNDLNGVITGAHHSFLARKVFLDSLAGHLGVPLYSPKTGGLPNQ